MRERLDTATQRPPTGLNRGAREMILGIVWDQHLRHYVSATQVVAAFFENRYSSWNDYYEALEEVWGAETRTACAAAVAEAESRAVAQRTRNPLRRIFGGADGGAAARALLLTMPEPDFRLAIETAPVSFLYRGRSAKRITEVCRSRGIPWVFGKREGFVWVGEPLVEEELLRPAQTVLADPRFAGGVRTEFESARNELHAGNPVARKQAVFEAASAVESALKVLLDEHRVPYAAGDTAQRLFDHLVLAGIVPRYMERMVLAAAQSRNKTAGHGAGANPHNVTAGQAEAVVGAAAGAIAYIGGLLP